MQLGHYLKMRTSKQYNQVQKYNEKSYNIKKKKKKQLWKKGTCLNKLKKIVFFFMRKI